MRTRILPLVLLALLSAPTAHAITAGEVDDFEDGTTEGWHHGTPSVDAPRNTATGGPAGAGDGFLSVSSGDPEGSPRLVALAGAQWLGNYTAAGITTVALQVNNLGPTSLALRFGVCGPGGAWVTSAVTLSTGSGWTPIQLAVGAADLISAGLSNACAPGTDAAATLAGVTEARLLSAAVAGYRGDQIVALLGMDNVQAVAAMASTSTTTSSTSTTTTSSTSSTSSTSTSDTSTTASSTSTSDTSSTTSSTSTSDTSSTTSSTSTTSIITTITTTTTTSITTTSTTTSTSTTGTTDPAISTTTTTPPISVCPPAPEARCAETFAKGLLVVVEKKRGKERMMAKLGKGPALAGADWGNPLTGGGTAYTVCVYNGVRALVAVYEVDRAGARCGARACWKSIGPEPPAAGHKGYAYGDESASADGIQAVLLKGGVDGRSKVVVKGRNTASALPTGVAAALATSSSATIQVRGSDTPRCASLVLPTVVKHDGRTFKAKK